MDCKVRIKTGFYQTMLYKLSILDNSLELFPTENPVLNNVRLVGESIDSIILVKKKYSRIEIKTKNRVYEGTFTGDPDLRDVQQELKNN